MPGRPSWQPKPSAAPAPVQSVQLTSFCPATLTHLRPPQLSSPVQKHPWPCDAQVPPTSLQPPLVQDQVPGGAVAASQASPSQASPASGRHASPSQVAPASSTKAASLPPSRPTVSQSLHPSE